jgi:hypothetical protein
LPELSVINLFEKFKTRKIQLGFEYRDLFWSKDGHHNAKGYNLWAACVAEEYTEQLSVSSQLVVEDTTDGMVLAF